ncbi:GntR family transcriptional regulator [Sphingomonas morindae]|uniref:GntR family transcriptional regulator n=1 Tax=Sphingomonas morindae TaxID=1541170 RepID=A0ABY4XED5_9SPHN|nr:GntR family transcriptional regulator [Sphingomonas morindae]USI75131.1 GntR family transcriptional regulator [Sphingomonas morindae]
MPNPSFSLHDVTDFPLVRFRSEAADPGYGPAWCAEMDALLEGRARFVLIYPKAERDEAHEDRKARGVWLKQNKDQLVGVCLALIVVEPDPARRAELEAMLPNLVRAFGTPQVATASTEDAQTLARRLLAEEVLDAR